MMAYTCKAEALRPGRSALQKALKGILFYFIILYIVFSVSWGSVSFDNPGQPVTHGRLPTFAETLQFKIIELRSCRLDF